ncbi:E3 ubiquitin protein ligase DRIP2 [Vitis vinifera]|uniref:E3 ubiquitin protein ligase DRIP2 n=1 Tax=Vitis vinifera TaxID=29760 RepID=A0A438DRP5_VITVI|nr:E3 ubiquitin protein ligase DRIP2 [Vitis vinifera]
MPPIPLPVKRKERSLSSLVVSTPRVSMQTGLTGRRTKAVARKSTALRESSSSPESRNKVAQTKKQNSSISEASKDQKPNKDTENDADPWDGKVDLWTPLNCLVEAANRTKSSKFNSQGTSLAKSEPFNAPDSEVYMPKTKAKAEPLNAADGEVCIPKTKIKEHGHKIKVQDDKNGAALLPGPVKRRRMRAVGRKRISASGEMCTPAQVVLSAAGAKRGQKKLSNLVLISCF